MDPRTSPPARARSIQHRAIDLHIVHVAVVRVAGYNPSPSINVQIAQLAVRRRTKYAGLQNNRLRRSLDPRAVNLGVQ